MKLEFCAVCGTTSDLHQHHIEPVVFTGIRRKKLKGYDNKKPLKDCTPFEVFAFLFDQGIISDDGELTVCGFHHNIIHGIVKFQMAEHGKLIQEGIKKAIAKGVQLGRPTILNDDIIKGVNQMREQGVSIKKIADYYSIGVGTVYQCFPGSKKNPNTKPSLEKFLK